MHAYRLPQRRFWIQGALSVTLGLALGAYLLGLSVADLPLDWFVLLVLAIILPSIAVLSGNLKRFFIAMIILDMTLSLDLHLFSRPIQASVNGLWLSVTTLSLIALYSLWAIELLTRKVKIDPCWSVSLPAFCFIAAGLLSIIGSKDPMLSVLELVLIVELFLMFFYLANHLRNLDDLRFISRLLLVGMLIMALSIFAVNFLGAFRIMGMGGEMLGAGSEYPVRSGGLIGHPNAAATYLAAISVLALATLLIAKEANFSRLLASVTLPIGITALILTFSRGGWVNFVVAGLIFTLLALRRKWLRWQHVVLLIVVLGILVFLFREPILYRLFGEDYGAAYSRKPQSIMAISMIKAHPWIGVGINNFVVSAEQYIIPELIGKTLLPVHNKYLLVWSETGTIGILSFIMFYLAICREAWQCYKSEHPILAPLGAALVAGLCGYATHMMVDRFGVRSALQVLWLIAAIAFSTRRLIQGSEQLAPDRESMPQPAEAK